MVFKPGNPFRFKPGNKTGFQKANRIGLEDGKPYRFMPGNQLYALARGARRGTLRRKLITALDETDVRHGTKMYALIKKLISLAISGDLLATQEIFNRVDGRVTAARGNEEVGPAITEMVVRWMTLQEAEAAQAAMPILDLAPLPAPGENEST